MLLLNYDRFSAHSPFNCPPLFFPFPLFYKIKTRQTESFLIGRLIIDYNEKRAFSLQQQLDSGAVIFFHHYWVKLFALIGFFMETQ